MASISIRWVANGRNRRYGQSRKIKGSYTAGLLVAAGRFKLVTEALDDMTRMKRRAEEKQSEKANKKVMNYTATLNKVQAIRALNKQEHECTFSQTKTMVSWYKRIGDAPLPATAYLPGILIQWDVAMHQSQLLELYRHQQPQLKRTTRMKFAVTAD